MDRNVRVVFQDDRGEKFFGEGPYRLLSGVEKNGSLHKTAEEMEMSWSKAFRIIKKAEEVLGFPLLERKTGGSGGGGSRITPEGKAWIRKYERFRDACREQEERIFREVYPEYSSGALIMASGEGKRFGGNKLMAPFAGEPMIQRILAATDSLFLTRVAVTRNRETESYLKEQGICTVFHDLPGRNDTIRLGLLKVMEKEAAGCLICQADQPLLRHETVRQLLKKAAEEPEMIWRVSSGDGPGSPVWFPKHLFPELLSLPEGKGGREILKKHPELLRIMEVNDPLELKDVDTKEDLEELQTSGRDRKDRVTG